MNEYIEDGNKFNSNWMKMRDVTINFWSLVLFHYLQHI